MDVTSIHGRSEEINPYRSIVQASAVGDGELELWPLGERKSPQICCLAREEGNQQLNTCWVWILKTSLHPTK